MISAKDLKWYFEPYVPAVKECYAAYAHAQEVDGTLRLELAIRPDGSVNRFGFAATGVNGELLSTCAGCHQLVRPNPVP